MIKLERIRTKDAIPRGLRGELRIKKERELLRSKRERGEEKPDFNPKHWGKAREQLQKESEKKCSYCESPTPRGDVDHFRPKSIYWWLAYCYDNLVFSCADCNQTFKRDHFPIGGSPSLVLKFSPI